MVESSDLQSAIQRTQAMERIQQLQNQQEELNRKRFELEMARHRAERAKKVAEAEKAEKKVVRDRYDGDAEDPSDRKRQRSAPGAERDPDDDTARGGGLDVRV